MAGWWWARFLTGSQKIKVRVVYSAYTLSRGVCGWRGGRFRGESTTFYMMYRTSRSPQITAYICGGRFADVQLTDVVRFVRYACFTTYGLRIFKNGMKRLRYFHRFRRPPHENVLDIFEKRRFACCTTDFAFPTTSASVSGP